MVINRFYALLLFTVLSISLINAQVEINTENPKVIWDVVSASLDGSTRKV